jgi:hypothetical protein
LHGHFAASKTIPFPLETGRPVGQQMRLVEQHNGTTLCFCDLLGAGPQSFPKAGQGRIWPIRGSVEGLLFEPVQKFKQQGRLADLTGSRKELNAGWSRFRQPAGKQFEAAAKPEPVVTNELSRLIIRL